MNTELLQHVSAIIYTHLQGASVNITTYKALAHSFIKLQMVTYNASIQIQSRCIVLAIYGIVLLKLCEN